MESVPNPILLAISSKVAVATSSAPLDIGILSSKSESNHSSFVLSKWPSIPKSSKLR
jgi:hypothetical protein